MFCSETTDQRGALLVPHLIQEGQVLQNGLLVLLQ